MPAERKPKPRDAERSREAILAAAEELFAARGFDGAGLGEVAAAAGLSRGAPSYFFGSKEKLYIAVLQRAFAARERATREACRALVEWAEPGRGGAIRRPLARAVEGYLEFLLDHPQFVRLVQWEELAGAGRLGEASRESAAVADAFTRVRSVGRERGLRAFAVPDAVFLFVALTFFAVAQHATFTEPFGRDLHEPDARQRHVRFVVEQLLRLVEST